MRQNHLPQTLLCCVAFVSFATGAATGKSLPADAIRLGVVTEKRLREISGLVASRRYPGILWVHNDGSDGRLYALRTNGQVAAVFKLPAPVQDLEDIAIGPGREAGTSDLYLGDIGDNDASRRSIAVHRLPEPELPSGPVSGKPGALARMESFALAYPDGGHDAEALLADPLTGDLFVVTKEKQRARVYVAHRDQLRAQSPVTMALAREINLRRCRAETSRQTGAPSFSGGRTR